MYASSGNPHFEIAYSSIHDDTGLEIYNTAGNESMFTQSCFWDGDGCQYSGAVTVQQPNNSLPDWDGDTTSVGSPLGKILVRRDDGLLVDPYLSDEEKIQAYKEIIANDPKSEEAKEALTWLYSISSDSTCERWLIAFKKQGPTRSSGMVKTAGAEQFLQASIFAGFKRASIRK